jgi:hypothetical protein
MARFLLLGPFMLAREEVAVSWPKGGLNFPLPVAAGEDL